MTDVFDLRETIVGGRDNLIVQSHPWNCHHCGYAALQPEQACTECGVQAHLGCVFFEDGKCDGCRLGVSSDRCVLCERSDDEELSMHSTDRFVKYVVMWGRTWTRGSTRRRELVPLRVDASHRVVRMLRANPSFTFGPDELPEYGQRLMEVFVDGVRYTSDPLIVHTWCVHSLFQHPIPFERAVGEAVQLTWSTLLNELSEPTRRPDGVHVGVYPKIGCFDDHACLFCGCVSGFKTFCFTHMDMDVSSTQGCSHCRWSHAPRYTHLSFHPTCAVKHGMRRVVHRVKGAGMICATGASKRILRRFCTVRGACKGNEPAFRRVVARLSGINVNLVEVHSPFESEFDVPPTCLTKGHACLSRNKRGPRPMRFHDELLSLSNTVKRMVRECLAEQATRGDAV